MLLVFGDKQLLLLFLLFSSSSLFLEFWLKRYDGLSKLLEEEMHLAFQSSPVSMPHPPTSAMGIKDENRLMAVEFTTDINGSSISE